MNQLKLSVKFTFNLTVMQMSKHIEILQMAILLETSISVERSTNYLFAYFI